MRGKWILASPLDYERNPESFPKAESGFFDPEGKISQWIAATRVVPINAKEWKCLPGWHMDVRVVNDSMWFCFPNGRGTVALPEERRRFDFGPGDLILIPKGVPHAIRLKSGVAQYSVHFHPYVFGSINLLDLAGFPFHVPAEKDGYFAAVSARLSAEYAGRSPLWAHVMAGEIFQVLVHVARRQGKLFRQRGSFKKELPRLLPALQLLEKKWNDPGLQVGDLSRAVSMSEVYFRKLFRQVAGMAPVQFIQGRRIEEACRLLRGTQRSIQQVAEDSGFLDMAFFYRTFHRWTGKTPGAYRETTEV